MIRPDSISGWSDVDLANARLDDFRPLYAVCSALAEREAACGLKDGWKHWFMLERTGYLGCPSIRFLLRIADGIHDLARRFVNLEPSVPYATNHWQGFPVWYSSFDISNSDHPLALLPRPGSTAATPGAIGLYRNFLADAKHWLGRFRYVYADKVGATRRLRASGSGDTAGDLAGDFADDVESVAVPRRFGNGSAVYEGYGRFRTGTHVYYDSHDHTIVEDYVTSDDYQASAEEFSGVWVANPSPIPANLTVYWGYVGESDVTLYHPGTHERKSSAGLEPSYQESAEGLWGSESRPVLAAVSADGLVTRTKWTYSPDGTQSKTETSTSPLSEPIGEHSDEDDERTVYSMSGWTHAADTSTDFGVLRGGESMAILPEKASLDLPPTPGSVAPPIPAYPLSSFTGIRERYVGPISFHAVLDYGPHYKFP